LDEFALIRCELQRSVKEVMALRCTRESEGALRQRQVERQRAQKSSAEAFRLVSQALQKRD